MYILLTGATAAQANVRAGMKIAYISTAEMVFQALVLGGHEVDFRPVRPGENLSGYDCAFVGVTPIDKGPAKYAFGTLWALAWDLPKCICFDDYKLGLRASQPFSGNPTTLRREAIGRTHRAEADRVWPILFETAQHFKLPQSQTSAHWNVPVIGPFLHERCLDLFRAFNPIGELHGYLASAFIPDYPLDNQPERDRRWISAALGNHDPWIGSLGLTWPVGRFGHGTEPRVDEREIVQIYGRSWGVLSPRYQHAGSGWWRVRFDYAARCRCILLGSDDEVDFLGPAYSLVADDPGLVESLSDDDLRDLAERQHEALQPHLWSRDRTVEWFDDWVKELVRRGKSDTPIDQARLRAACFEPLADHADIFE